MHIWKIEVTRDDGKDAYFTGWALARSAKEALGLSGVPSAHVERMPGRLWIWPRNMRWEN